MGHAETRPFRSRSLGRGVALLLATMLLVPMALSSAQGPRPGMQTVRGRVVDDQGHAVVGVVVEAHRRATASGLATVPQTREREVLSREEGRFEMELGLTGVWSISARGPHGRRATEVVLRIDENTVPEPIELTMPRTGVLLGSVLGPTGEPVSGASIWFVGAFDARSDAEPAARTLADGSFRIDDVPSGNLEIYASHPDHLESERQRLSLAPAELHTVKLALRIGGRIEGVIDPSMGVVAGLPVQLYSFSGSIGWQDTTSDAEGHFCFPHVVPAEYVVEIQRLPGARVPVVVHEGVTSKLLFERRPGGPIVIQATILCGGEPIAGVQIGSMLLGAGWPGPQGSSSDEQGALRTEVARAGEYLFRLGVGPEDSYDVRRLVPDLDHCELRFELPGGAVKGRLVGGRGDFLGEIPITLCGEDPPRDPWCWNHQHRTHTRDDGSFEFRFLERGSYTLRVLDSTLYQSRSTPSPFARTAATVVVEEEGVDLGELHLVSGGTVAGQVIDEFGIPVRGAFVALLDTKGDSLSVQWEEQTDEAGAFTLDSVPEGRFRVEVATREARTKSDWVEVSAGEVARIVVTLGGSPPGRADEAGDGGR